MMYVRLWCRFVVQAFVRETHFRAHFFSTLVVGIVQFATALIPIWLVFGFTSRISGWDRSDVVLLAGMQQIAVGLLAAFLAPNLARVSEYLRRGDLDAILLRPVDAQFFLTFRWVDLAELSTVLTGAGVVGLVRLRHGGLPPAATAQALLLGLCGLVLLGCAWSAVVYSAFWLQAVDPVTGVVLAALDTGKYPVTFFPAGIRIFLTGVFPIAFATTFPAMALTRGIGWWVVGVGVLAGAGALTLLRLLWRLGLRGYSSASS